jgi:uncharacterized phiE125 gp8 family phage protein
MSQLLLEGPTLEPLSIAQAREWLRVEHEQDNDLIGALIVSARMVVEQTTRRLLLAQRWRITSSVGSERIGLSPGPLLSVDEVRVRPAAGLPVIVDASTYRVENESADLVFSVSPAVPPGARIEIDLTAGFGQTVSAIPAPMVQAIRMLVARWYEHRGDSSVIREAAAPPPDVMALLAPYRRMRIA